MNINKSKPSEKNKKLISEKKIKELKKILLQRDRRIEKSHIKILFDEEHSRQYSLKIPKKIAEYAQIDPENDLIECEVQIPQDYQQKPTLRMKLIRNGGQNI